MKKLLIATLCATAFTLTACDKKPADSNTSTAAAVSLSSNNISDMKADLERIETLSASKANEALDYQKKIVEAATQGSETAVKDVIGNLKTFMEGFNTELSALKIQSSEVDAIRKKMIEANQHNLELSESATAANPDADKITELTNKSTELQKELIADMTSLKAKIAEAK